MENTMLIGAGAADRTIEQEDEDTEQKIINEGSTSAAHQHGACSRLFQSTRHGKRTALSFTT
jgi:hypothetical protein